MMELRLLGPVEVWSGGARIEAGPPKARCVLAVLGLSAGTPVSTEAILDRVWGDAPPPKVRGALHAYVTRLRRLLDPAVLPASGTVLPRGSGGYVLQIPPEQVDALRFRQLIEQARRTAENEERGGLLRHALGLWRGDPLSGISGDWADSVRVGLREQRLNALLERIDLDLDKPVVHLALVEELTELLSEHPLCEPLAARLMSALGRIGRAADALVVYDGIRKRLAEELGSDPGLELRQLYRRTLRLTGVALPESTSVGSGTAEVPRQLPIAPAVFVGRTREFDAVAEVLTRPGETPQLAVLHGPGGVGKSALSLTVGRAASSHYPDGQLYLNLQGFSPGLKPLAAADALNRLLQSLGVPASAVPAEEQAAAARLRSLLADKRVLLVLDNAADAAQVRPLLPAGPRCATLVTSRRALYELGDATHVALKVLPATASVELLVRLDPTGRCAADPQGAVALAQLCGHLPLAIRITAARILARPDWPLSAFVERLSDRQHLLDQLGHEDLSVRACFETSYLALENGDPLDADCAEAFRLLGLPDGPDISVPIAARLFDTTEREAERSLDRLVEAQLLESAVPGRYRTHDLIRLYARELAERDIPEADRYTALARTWRCYVATTVRAGQLFRPGFRADVVEADPDSALSLADRESAAAWLDDETANLLAAGHQASAAPADSWVTTTRLARALFGFMHNGVHWADLRELNLKAHEIARRHGDRAAEAQILSDLGVLTWRTGDADGAIQQFMQGAQILRDLDNSLGEARCLGNLGNAYGELGDRVRARQYLEPALDAYREAGYPSGHALMLNALSQANWLDGNVDLAIQQAREALAIYEAEDDSPGASLTLRILGRYLAGRDNAEAVASLQAAIAISRSYGDLTGVVWALANLGQVWRRSGDTERALEVCNEALVLSRKLGAQQEQGFALLSLGGALLDRGDRENAAVHLREAVAILRQLGAQGSAEAEDLLRQAESDADRATGL